MPKNPAKLAIVKNALKNLGRGTLKELVEEIYQIEKQGLFEKRQDVRRWSQEEVHKYIVGETWVTKDAAVKSNSIYDSEFVWTPTKRDREFYSWPRPYDD